MYIKTVKIKNYRNFGEVEFQIDLNPFTLIIGENNIGKTNLFNAIGLILNQEITLFKKRFLEVDDINYKTVHSFKAKVLDIEVPASSIVPPEVTVEIVLTGFEKEEEIAVVSDCFTNKEFTEAKYKYSFKPKTKQLIEDWITSQRTRLSNLAVAENRAITVKDVGFPKNLYRYFLTCGPDDADCDYNLLRMLRMEYIEALRDAGRELSAGYDNRLLFRILNHKKEYDGIRNDLAKLEESVNKEPNLAAIKQNLEELVEQVTLKSTPAQNGVDFTLNLLETDDILRRISLIYGADPISVIRNGLGKNNLLFMSLLLSQVAAIPIQGEDDLVFRVIAIEEPEAHLHPQVEDLFARKIEKLREQYGSGLQVLVSSHSPQLTSQITLCNSRILFKDAQEKLQSHPILKDLDSSESQTIDYLEKYLDATKCNLFFARRLILVEGISEALLIPSFYEKETSSTIAKDGITIVNVNGLAFSRFLKIIKNGYFIKCSVLTDSDFDTASEDRAEKLIEQYKAFPHIISIHRSKTETFEKDLFDANKTGTGKAVILDALERIKPRKGKAIKKEFSAKDLDVEQIFAEIKSYKSEFAFALGKLVADGRKIETPKYIKEAITFASS